MIIVVRIHEGLSCAFTRDFHCRAHLQGMHPCSLSCIHEGLSCAITRDCHCRAHLQGMHPCSLSCAFTRGCRAHSQEIVIAVRIYKECIPVHCRAFTRGCRAHSQGIVIAVRIYKKCIPDHCRAHSQASRLQDSGSLAGTGSLLQCKCMVCCSANAWFAAVQMHGFLQCKCIILKREDRGTSRSLFLHAFGI